MHFQPHCVIPLADFPHTRNNTAFHTSRIALSSCGVWEVERFRWRFHRSNVKEARYHERALMWRPVVESMGYSMVVDQQSRRNCPVIQNVPLLQFAEVRIHSGSCVDGIGFHQ